MNRRSFLHSLLAGAAGAAAYELDADKLLWTPGKKTIFLPPSPPLPLVGQYLNADYLIRIPADVNLQNTVRFYVYNPGTLTAVYVQPDGSLIEVPITEVPADIEYT